VGDVFHAVEMSSNGQKLRGRYHVMQRMAVPACGYLLKVLLSLNTKTIAEHAQAQQLLSIAHGEIRKIKTWSDRAPQNSRSTTSALGNNQRARAKPSARFDYVLQLVEVCEVLAQDGFPHVTGDR
jgi:hypothetical protein